MGDLTEIKMNAMEPEIISPPQSSSELLPSMLRLTFLRYHRQWNFFLAAGTK
jgi:hypothetical protein